MININHQMELISLQIDRLSDCTQKYADIERGRHMFRGDSDCKKEVLQDRIKIIRSACWNCHE